MFECIQSDGHSLICFPHVTKPVVLWTELTDLNKIITSITNNNKKHTNITVFLGKVTYFITLKIMNNMYDPSILVSPCFCCCCTSGSPMYKSSYKFLRSNCVYTFAGNMSVLLPIHIITIQIHITVKNPQYTTIMQTCLSKNQHTREIIDHSTTQHKLRPFLGVWQATRKDDAAKCKSTLDLLPEDLSLSCFGEGKLTQRSKQQGYRVFLCAMLFSWFLFCYVEHRHLTTCTKACQTISGLIRKTRGHLIILRHAIGWNLRVCLLWLTGVESSISAPNMSDKRTKTWTTYGTSVGVYVPCIYLHARWELL